MKRDIEVFDYANDILTALKAGILLTTKVQDKINVMTISAGSLGIQWGRPIFMVFVRENRFTKSQLDTTLEFTINAPYGAFDKRILGICGTKSGRDIDKIAELGLTPEPPRIITVPAIRQFPLTLECRVIYRQKQDSSVIPDEVKKVSYPQDVDSFATGANRDFHTVYYGEIVSAYIIE